MIRLLTGDCRAILSTLPAQSVHCCVTSPPYFGLRDYGADGQIGLEPTPQAYVEQLVAVFREVRRVLRDDGTLWLNLGDSYANDGKWGGHTGGIHPKALHGSPIGRNKKCTGLKPKDLIGIPWRVAFALQADGRYLRQDIIWSKPNPMPESVTDRCTKAHEYMFLLSKNVRYYYDQEAIMDPVAREWIPETNNPGWLSGKSKGQLAGYRPREKRSGTDFVGFRNGPNPNGRNKRSVWEIATQPYSEAHFATFPPALIEPCILAGCPEAGTVLDPFSGAGTTGLVADRHNRNALLIELNPAYSAMGQTRIHDDAPLFVQTSLNI